MRRAAHSSVKAWCLYRGAVPCRTAVVDPKMQTEINFHGVMGMTAVEMVRSGQI
ncbi:extensin [Iris pallida]|uniref:Extensin n=1 Tax=Iris pallida TaxID=29817 RepID=A0AAX6EWE9_IRIPA|nr:extensin [Iris pallida]